MKHQRCRCLGGITISHTQQQTATVIPFCTAITMQYNSYAIRSQSVLTTNSTGRVYKVQFECRARHSTYTSEIASIACLHSYPVTYQLLGSQLWIVLSTENSRPSATTVAQARAVGLRENFAGPTKLFCSTNELTSCKAVSCKLFCL